MWRRRSRGARNFSFGKVVAQEVWKRNSLSGGLGILQKLKQFADIVYIFLTLYPTSSNYYTLAYRPKLPLLISDIRTLALTPERQSARISEIKNGRLGLYGAKHSKCNHVMTLGFQGLKQRRPKCKNFRTIDPDSWPVCFTVAGVSDIPRSPSLQAPPLSRRTTSYNQTQFDQFTRFILSSAGWAIHISWSKCCLCVRVCVGVNQGVVSHLSFHCDLFTA